MSKAEFRDLPIITNIGHYGYWFFKFIWSLKVNLGMVKSNPSTLFISTFPIVPIKIV